MASTVAGLPVELIAALRDLYEPAEMKVTGAAHRETESTEYGACRLELDGHHIVFRVAKTTPTKIGQFVTLWKRPVPDGEIAPLDTADGVAFAIISVSDGDRIGQFVFDQRTLVDKGVMSVRGKGGKRAIRVYPPWTQPVAKDAMRTQSWQLRHFLPLGRSSSAAAVRRLFRLTPPGSMESPGPS